jgi:hypothetical protein
MAGVSECPQEAAVASGTGQTVPKHRYPKAPIATATLTRGQVVRFQSSCRLIRTLRRTLSSSKPTEL